jgi:hypothetical protein
VAVVVSRRVDERYRDDELTGGDGAGSGSERLATELGIVDSG